MSDEAIIEIPLAELHDSPFQPRTTYSGLQELADNIKAEGRIHSPLVVRLRRNGPREDVIDGFELVYGHRRKRAAAVAGLTCAPCVVRNMTDAQVRSAQMTENVQRENMNALDEGRGFQAQIDAGDATADEIAVRIGKSRSWVYGRTQLLKLCPQLRQAYDAGEIGADAALLVARLRTTKLQEKALQAIKADNEDLTDGGKQSYRRIKSLLAEKFTLRLKEALFDIEDEMLLPAAGHCMRCPKRTGNAPEFADLVEGTTTSWGRHQPGSADICTDPDCFAAKKLAHLAREAAKLREGGHEVIDGNKARNSISAVGEVKGAFIALDKVKGLLKKLPKGRGGAIVAPAPQTVLIQDPRGGKLVKAVRRADLEAAGLAIKQLPAPDNHQARQAAEARRRKEAQERAVAETARRMALLQHVRQVAASRERDAFDLRLVAAAAFAGVDYHEKDFVAELHGFKDGHALKKAIDTMDVAPLTALVMDCAIVDNVKVETYTMDTQPGPLLALAQHYGVDVKAIRDEASGAARDPATGDLLAQAELEEAAA